MLDITKARLESRERNRVRADAQLRVAKAKTAEVSEGRKPSIDPG
jgi:hypothetical protein